VGEQHLEKKLPTVLANEQRSGIEELLIKINRETNELIFADSKTGRETKIKAQFIDDEGETAFEPKPPLTVDEFREVLGRLNKLGITWNTDIPPTPVFMVATDDAFWKEYGAIQREFPSFPYELNQVIFHAFLKPVSNKEIDKKVDLLGNLLTQEYRAEFFFKYAIKVSYFEDIDWEVVVKAYEKGADRMPKIAYALLSLILRNPVNTTLSLEEAANAHREPQFVTVAVNEGLLDKLMRRLVEIKTALEKAQAATASLAEPIPGTEESVNEPSS
jgi:hypothetical protein